MRHYVAHAISYSANFAPVPVLASRNPTYNSGGTGQGKSDAHGLLVLPKSWPRLQTRKIKAAMPGTANASHAFCSHVMTPVSLAHRYVNWRPACRSVDSIQEEEESGAQLFSGCDAEGRHPAMSSTPLIHCDIWLCLGKSQPPVLAGSYNASSCRWSSGIWGTLICGHSHLGSVLTTQACFRGDACSASATGAGHQVCVRSISSLYGQVSSLLAPFHFDTVSLAALLRVPLLGHAS